MIRFAENLNKMIAAGLGGAMEAPSTEVAVGYRIRYLEASGPVASFETNVVAPIKKLLVNMLPVQAGSGDPSPDNIRPITGRDAVTVYRSGADMSNPQSVTVQLGQTVYGGTLDVTSGKLTVTHGIIDLGTLSWTPSASATSGYKRFGAPIASPNPAAKAFPAEIVASAICSAYPTKSGNDVYSRIDGVSITSTGNIMIYDSRYAQDTAANFKAAVSGYMLCYELATPQTIQLTPAQLSTLAGENNVWSDAGNISLEFPYYEETEGY